MDHECERVCDDRIVDDKVPYIVFESAQTRSERTIKRLIVALIMTIILLFLSNAYWIHEWSQYDYESEEIIYSQDGRGINSVNWGTQGDIWNNGTGIDYTEEETQTPGN